jgi:hypothetical protein
MYSVSFGTESYGSCGALTVVFHALPFATRVKSHVLEFTPSLITRVSVSGLPSTQLFPPGTDE